MLAPHLKLKSKDQTLSDMNLKGFRWISMNVLLKYKETLPEYMLEFCLAEMLKSY